MFNQIMLSQADLDKCVEFGKAQLPTSSSHYARRGQTNQDKILEDIVTGKMGEIGISLILGTEVPDFAIYTGKKKSWAADLLKDGKHIHCKTQSKESMKRYGLSWIFQYGGNGHGHVDKLFKELDDDKAYFVGASVDGLLVTIHCVMPVKDLVTYDLIKMPVLDWLKNSKRAVYFDDIEPLGPDIQYNSDLIDIPF